MGTATNRVGSIWATLGAGGTRKPQHQGGPWQEVDGEPVSGRRPDLDRRRELSSPGRGEGKGKERPSCCCLPETGIQAAREGLVGDPGDPSRCPLHRPHLLARRSSPYRDYYSATLQPPKAEGASHWPRAQALLLGLGLKGGKMVGGGCMGGAHVTKST